MLDGKNWNKELELEIVKEWVNGGKYRFDIKSKKKIFSIDTPPPYVNSPVHMGHASTYAIMDMIARYKRMEGYEVLFPLGMDRNGLPIEISAEKMFKKKLTECTREEFLDMCKLVLDSATRESVDTFFREGICFNSYNVGAEIGDAYETDSSEYRVLTQSTFIDLWNNGLIYEAERVNNYCSGCQTTIADSEIEYEERDSLFTDIKFKIKGDNEEIIVGTTRPEFLYSCAMILYNPNDIRYKHLEGKFALVPISNLEVPIKAHTLAEIDKGTGLVMMCSFGDNNDVRFFREEKLEPKILINLDGTINDKAALLNGLNVKDARVKILELLKEKNLIVFQKKIKHRTPLCAKSKDDVEFICMKEFYLRQLEFKDKMLEFAEKIRFFSSESRQILIDWINSINIDWPISRRRYYATEIPLWYCEKCGEIFVPKKGKYYVPWKEECPIKRCKCGSKIFIGETRVFDTWFDSSISPLYILGYERNSKFFKRSFPCSLRPQGKEIVRTWLYYTILKSYLLTNKLVFKDVWIHHHILDERGLKMSKSLGNVIDPKIVLERYSGEALRLWCVVEGNLTNIDFNCSYERIGGASKTIAKLWNVAKFICMFDSGESKKLLVADKWILGEINKLVEECNVCYEVYDFHNPILKLKHFLWEDFASHYIELVKKRVYNQDNMFSKSERNGAVYTLKEVFKKLLECLAPIIPMISYKIYLELYNKDVHFVSFPKFKKMDVVGFSSDDIINLNSLIWKIKRENGLSLKDSVEGVVILKKMFGLEKDIKYMHNIKSLVYGDIFEVRL
ncbi:MAG TPA: valine--tRNA ligase [Candidatus Nanoarchaeia archaeon]|nr:valine--tRNA ligase [Candidatus Nanoarchaeia archaeon]